MRQIPWYRTVSFLRASLVLWAVLLLLDIYLLVVDPSRWVQHGLQALVPIVLGLGLVTINQLWAALRTRAASRDAAPTLETDRPDRPLH